MSKKKFGLGICLLGMVLGLPSCGPQVDDTSSSAVDPHMKEYGILNQTYSWSLKKMTVLDGQGNETKVDVYELDKYNKTFEKDLVIPDEIYVPAQKKFAKVVQINKECFKGHTELKTVKLGKYITELGDEAFKGATQLESIIEAPDSVIEKVGAHCFEETIFESKAAVAGDIYFGKSLYKAKSNVIDMVIKEGTLNIAPGAFLGLTSLKTIVAPESLETIGSHAFEGCTNLVSVIIPNTNNNFQSLGTELFKNCTNLEQITLPDATFEIAAVKVSEDKAEKGNFSFLGCAKLSEFGYNGSVTLKSLGLTTEKTITGTDNKPLKINELSPKLEKITIVTKEDRLVAEAFASDTKSNIKEVSLSDNIKVIEDDAFLNCQNIESFKGPKALESIASPELLETKYFITHPEIENIGAVLVKPSNLSSETITIPTGIVGIFPGALKDNKSVKKVILPDSIKYVGNSSFENCPNLKEITNTDKLLTVGINSFKGSGITSFNGSNLLSIADNALASCVNLESVTLGGTTTIGKTILKDDKKISSIVTSGKYLISSYFNDPLSSFELQKQSNLKKGDAGYKELYPDSFNSLRILGADKLVAPYFAFRATNLTSLLFDEGITEIGHHAFKDCAKVKSINLHQVEKINSWAFARCEGITEFIIEEIPLNAKLDEFGNIVGHDKYTVIESFALYGCLGLTSLALPGTVRNIKNLAFFHCKNLKTVTLVRYYLVNASNKHQYIFPYGVMVEAAEQPNEWKYIDNTTENIDNTNANIYFNCEIIEKDFLAK